MDLTDRVSESVIKIFHNAKFSIVNDVAKWAEDLDVEREMNKSSLTDEPSNRLEADFQAINEIPTTKHL